MTDALRPPEYELAHAILAIAADPVKSKARLDDLTAKEASIKELTEALNEARAEHHAAHTNAVAITAAAKAERKSLDARAKELDHKAADLEAREARLAKLADEHAEVAQRHATVHEQSSVALSAREKRVNDRENVVEQREFDVAAAEADYAGRISKLEELVGRHVKA